MEFEPLMFHSWKCHLDIGVVFSKLHYLIFTQTLVAGHKVMLNILSEDNLALIASQIFQMKNRTDIVLRDIGAYFTRHELVTFSFTGKASLKFTNVDSLELMPLVMEVNLIVVIRHFTI